MKITIPAKFLSTYNSNFIHIFFSSVENIRFVSKEIQNKLENMSYIYATNFFVCIWQLTLVYYSHYFIMAALNALLLIYIQ